jgi:hypothetical protein
MDLRRIVSELRIERDMIDESIFAFGTSGTFAGRKASGPSTERDKVGEAKRPSPGLGNQDGRIIEAMNP